MAFFFNKDIPENPGVYLMKDSHKIIYIGKAKNLSNRINSYFHKEHLDEKTKQLINSIVDIDFIICNSEIDALILENNLIKKYSPKYNINLKDEKTYPYILITNEKFPKIVIIRNSKNLKKDLGDYFGPFPYGATDLKDTLTKIYRIRDCKRDMEKIYSQPCLRFHMKLCDAPCKFKSIYDEYNINISFIKNILNGKIDFVIKELNFNMTKAVDNFEFEKAIIIREQIKEINSNIQKQITENNSLINEDIFTFKLDNNMLFISVLNILNGKILNKIFHKISLEKILFDNLIQDILIGYYSKYLVPNTIIFEENLKEQSFTLNNIFEKVLNKKVKLLFPKVNSRRKELLEMGLLNLNKDIENFYNSKNIVETGLKNLYQILNLKRFPFKIECFDISNISGKDAVASMSVSIDGRKSTKLYRKFKIKTKDTPDDFAMMKEVIERRYKNIPAEEFPDIILIDGGLGQINAVADILKNLNRHNISTLLSIAKKEELVYKYPETAPYTLSKNNEALKILQRTRDEAHRFGITYHRLLRQKRVISSELDNIPGIGPKRRTLLLKTFGSVNEIKNTTLEELEKIIP
ncbi:MAG: excinuclease ABC subunit UvrC, partial [Cetobacterium sp.]